MDANVKLLRGIDSYYDNWIHCTHSITSNGGATENCTVITNVGELY